VEYNLFTAPVRIAGKQESRTAGQAGGESGQANSVGLEGIMERNYAYVYGKLRGRNVKAAKDALLKHYLTVKVTCTETNPRTHRRAMNNEVPANWMLEGEGERE
jgi:hypothetical protein